MKNRAYIFILMLLWGCTKQNKHNESISNPQIDSIQQLVNLVKTAKELSIEDQITYLKIAETQLNGIENDSIQLDELSKISLAYKRIGDSIGFRKSNAVLRDNSKEKKLNQTLGYSNWDLAAFLQSNGVLDSAFYYYNKALDNFEQLPVDSTSKSLKARMLYNMSRIQDSYKDYLGGEISTTTAIEIFDDLGDDYRLYNCYNVLGVLASGMGDPKKARESYEKAREYLNKSNVSNKTQLGWLNQNNIASIYLNSEDFEKAKEAYSVLLTDKDLEEKSPGIYEKALGSLAYSFLKADGNIEKAEELIDEAFEVNSESGDLQDRARLNYFYSEILAAKGDTTKAIAQAKESYAIATETYNNDRSLDALRLLNTLDPKNSNNYFSEYYQLNEAIKEEERTKRDKFARIRMETDDIIEENQILMKEKELWAGAFLLIILFSITAMVIISLYVSNNRLKFKQKQQESNQEIYNLMLSQQGKFEEGKQLEQKRISEELHDGILGEMLGIRLILGGLNEREDQASVEQRATLIEKLRDVEEEIRTISHELNHSSYEKFHNFIVSLENMIDGIQKSSGISCTFTYDSKVPWDNLLGDIKINAYRIIQEALKNCVKHAKSKNVSISFQTMDDKLKLIIQDDGVGFDTSRKKKGIGLKNIISRVKKIKGALDITSQLGKGTAINVTIPAKYVEAKIPEETNVLNA
ncbi:tetratricopeptide repeat-containing sensor histidine kinase [Flagellimonas crocea]|uniref:tetratricopeptide repeat-containing sensor histidine kinase n=1 Tax=Flagellimonas crocea TaxID=3067311 RepID=UPI00296F3955|nr:ATP-binding protein [Muricauda sp. DH64]